MEEFIKILIAILVLWSGYIFYKTHLKDGGTVTKKEFREYEKEFRAEMDTLNFKLDRNSVKIDTLLNDMDSVKLNIDSIKVDNEYILYNQDSLKRGQIIIYRKLSELKADKAEDRKFLNKLKRFIR